MARQKRNAVTQGLSGKINGQLLFKQYSYGTVVTKIPDRSRVILSEKQKSCNSTFRQAVAYARTVLNDPLKKAEYELGLTDGKTVYHTAIAEFLATKAGQH